MGFHTFDDDAAALEDPARYRYCSREELLEMLGLDGGERVVDLGSGTGFYTDDVAPFAAGVVAVDVQERMHAAYRDKGVPDNVDLVTADAGDLPFDDGAFDAGFSTMTFHEIAGPDALTEVARILDGRLVVVDWSADGDGVAGPPLDERFGPGAATEMLGDAGFEVVAVRERPETYAVVAR